MNYNQLLVPKTRTRVGRGLGSGLGKTSGRGQKVKTPVLAVAFAPVLKAAKCLFIVVYQNVVSTTLFAKQYAEVNVEQLEPF